MHPGSLFSGPTSVFSATNSVFSVHVGKIFGYCTIHCPQGIDALGRNLQSYFEFAYIKSRVLKVGDLHNLEFGLAGIEMRSMLKEAEPGLL